MRSRGGPGGRKRVACHKLGFWALFFPFAAFSAPMQSLPFLSSMGRCAYNRPMYYSTHCPMMFLPTLQTSLLA